ncbi:hypothetical protein EPICR_40194 [Candidatus Desulfarcum epimagneticum]|uniref:Uncharacterized protein n=1 Tax=uncultured Desulfobacteraceae bacterium TaxID=218296 RepID=A0A484HH65_9BACT|nr:hypothetical protein EPICR_40194 [uncultured Desulfobacteraceae bacterium]
MKDPIIEEVRRIRHEHSKLFDYDLDAICEDYKSRQKKIKSRLARLKPKPIATRHALRADRDSAPLHLPR